jgi:four helix bundle protein
LDGKEKTKSIASYRDLRVFQHSYELALKVHRITQKFPISERMELGSQLRRSAVSVPSNIAEGYGRKSFPEDFKRFLVIAMGSCNEVSVQLNLAKDLGYIDSASCNALQSECDEIGRGLNKLIQVWR